MLIYLIIGLLGGILSGLLGIGGGVLFVPLLTYLSTTNFKTNTGISSMAVVLVGTASATAYLLNDFSKGQNFITEIVIMIIAGILGSYFGSKLTFKINTKLLKRIFSVLLIFSGYRMIFANQVESITGDILILFFVIGFISGIGSGLLGIGGGIIRIPLLVLFGGFEQIIAQGISLITTVPTALTAAITKLRNDTKSRNIGLIVGSSGIVGSFIGGNIVFNISDEVLNISFGLFLFAVSINMFKNSSK
ncbi:MAG: sulfite exporter TauE/SafE family protein [Actinomycetota bacterium]|nr:sulfite exporter TauE/SafE family protein [Actinomycetota bacterium]